MAIYTICILQKFLSYGAKKCLIFYCKIFNSKFGARDRVKTIHSLGEWDSEVVSQNVVFFRRSCNQDALELDCLGFKSNRVIRISSNFRASKAKGKSHIDRRIRDYHYLLLEMLSSSLNLWKASSYCIVLGTQ